MHINITQFGTLNLTIPHDKITLPNADPTLTFNLKTTS